MSNSGKDLIEVIVKRLNDKDIRCYDAAIVNEIRELSSGELNQIVSFGDVAQWHNERLNTYKP